MAAASSDIRLIAALVANSANPCDRPLESPVFHTAPSEY
jgi:hypothetical protein